ncbi:ComEC family competence protein [Bradyrhizobium sp. ISRA443]|uniref:ComEC/Rec2 family competence protein n=1 Tax=unclassified Bradyrhizobium TaxID=2631580 RepID=UPI00247A31BA|nr:MULTISPECIES: ComEC/Rec2 family competence protein [unclassified Bradyrhizobium]WGR91980.1 ComEC family competence protein [Bradyrhizobium sp. ISRA435]WGS02394.1 ComEC family competence protein [Bradyrhizobium sp. ISRA436]WGS09279.1 ComEC family competence protein [Bradyrhizobium sp. ISRA437]WGS16168.1 ComEC family competence protein [Bradyrhizobium sp. ISRA443]
MAEQGTTPGGKRGYAGTWPPRAAVPAGGYIPARLSIWPSFVETLRQWARAEAGAGRLLPWVPVAFGTGIALYFAAEHEPVLWVAASVAIALCALAFMLRRQRLFPAIVMVAAVAAGFATATWRTAHVAHTVLARPMFSVALTGFVETRDIREKTDRFVLRVVSMESPRDATRLDRVRLSVKKGTAPEVGSFVALKARLLPPLGPQRPGSYDFGRDLYFQGIGASGFVMGAVKTTEPPASGGFALRYAAFMQGLRDAIDARIRTTLDGDQRAIATALLTGRRDAITTPVNDAMFISGLGHVLSISGYHMAVVAGVVFFAVRALLALFPALTAGHPIKKWAAASALVAAAFYLMLSGAEVATQRSFFMTAVVLIAVIVDRRAITFRTLAVAALIVLVIAPEALVHPSFQMSFAATLGLVALVQIGMPSLLASPDHSVTARVALWGGREIAMLVLASLVAGLATTPYAAFHFHRVTPYGLLANLAAMPVVSAVVMPAGLLGLAAMPFGFDGVFWAIMGVGIDWMIVVTQWVAGLPGAVGRMAAFGTGPLIVASAGLVLLGLLRTPLRWSGAALLAVALIWAVRVPQPDVLVAADGRNVAVRGGDGRLHLMRSGKDAFLVKEWLAADADARTAADPSLADGVSCDENGCVTQGAGGMLVSLAMRPAALADDCERAALIVTARPAPQGCAASVIDAERLRRHGALVLRRTRDGFAVDAVRPGGIDRPWSPAVPGDTESETALRPPGRAPRPAVDATPAEADLQGDD